MDVPCLGAVASRLVEGAPGGAGPDADLGVLGVIGEPLVVVGADGRITAANQATAELYGTTAAEIVGRTFRDPWWRGVREDGTPFPPEEHPAMVTLRSGEPAEGVVVGVARAGGPPVWHLVSAWPWPSRPGAGPDRVVVSFRDVTEWRADRAKAASLARFYAIRAATGRAIVHVEDRTALLYAVCEAALTEGRLAMAWIGFTDASGRVQPAAWAGVEAGYLRRVRVSADEALPEGGGPTGRAVRTGEQQVCDDIAAAASMSPWRDEAIRRGYRSSAAFPLTRGGVAVGAFSVYARETRAFDEPELALLAGVAEDLSFALEARESAARVRAVQEKLRASERRFRELVEAAPDAMVIVDGTGEIILVNRQTEAMFGFDRAELVGRTVEALLPEQFRAVHSAHRRSFFANHPKARPMGTSLDLFGLRRDGTEFPVEVSLSPLETADGRWVSAAVRDISDRKREEAIVLAALERERELTERLRELDRTKNDFVSTVSHELRTPLTSNMGFIELLSAEGSELTDEQRRFVSVLDRNSRRLHDLIQDLLQLAQIDAGGIALHLAPTDLAELVERAHAHVEAVADANGVALTVDVDPDLGTAVVDGQQLGRALENLLTNAVKFTPAGGKVALGARRAAREVRFVVSDTGLGIPEHEQARLFTRFFRSSVAIRKAIPGTGLGLAIVKSIVDSHGGTIDVRSALGAGTTVTISLPVPPGPAT